METRQEKLERIRREIAEGTYITPERLRIAARRMVDEMFVEAAVNEALGDCEL